MPTTELILKIFFGASMADMHVKGWKCMQKLPKREFMQRMCSWMYGKCQCHAQTRVAILYLIRYTWKVWSMEIEISKLFLAWLMLSFCALVVNIVSNWLHYNYIILVCCLSYLHISIRISSFGFQKTNYKWQCILTCLTLLFYPVQWNMVLLETTYECN